MAKLKPQDFSGLADRYIRINKLAEEIITAVAERQDLNMHEKAYLTTLTEFCNTGNTNLKADLKKQYTKLDQKAKNATQKDFSELLASLFVMNESPAERRKLNLKYGSTSQMFIPAAGNFPLIDFMIKTGSTVDDYSVKIMGKTTNTIKAHDILATVSTATKTKYRTETKLLECVANFDAKLGPIKALSTLASKLPMAKTGKQASEFKKWGTAGGTAQSIQASLQKDPSWYGFFEPLIDEYYARGKGTIEKAWRTHPYDALTVLAQYSIAACTKDYNWMPFVDEIQTKVTYFKFALNADGTPGYELVNGKSDRKPNAKYQLRAKSRLKEGAYGSRSGQDKLGIQP